jgi:L-ascorbate metabolism protein UlaG (beta-lactamase superfamily)
MAARLHWLGHSTVSLDMDGTRLLTDPLLRSRVLHLRRADGHSVDVLPGLDAVLVSHLHFDHLHIPSLLRLPRNTRILVPKGSARLLRRRGFGSVEELAAGDETQIGSLSVTGVPAVHDSRRLPVGIRAQPLGFVVRGTSSVYFAGDTELFDGMTELAPIDVALVPIWGWGPSLGRGHMNPSEAAEAVRMLQASVAIPIHWGTYFPVQLGLRGRPAFVELPVKEFALRMSELAPDVDVRALRPGEETVV